MTQGTTMPTSGQAAAHQRRGRRWSFGTQLALVATTALVVRITAVLSWSRWLNPEGDQWFYLRQGQDLAQGFGFVYRNNYGERVATAVHPPLYSAYLGLVGFLRTATDDHLPFRLATALLGVATVVVLGLAARQVAGNRAGLLAASLAAVYPNLWLNDVMILSESMYALTIALVLLASARFWSYRHPMDAAFLGGAVALAALARAEAQLLFVLLVVPLVLTAAGPTWRTRLRSLALALGVGAVVMAPWVVRNAVTFASHPLALSNGSGFVLEISNCDQAYGLAPPTDGKGHPLPDAEVDRLLGYWAVECDRTPWPAGDETVVGAAKQRTGLDYLNAHRSRFPVVLAARIGRIWDVWRPGQSYDFNRFFERRGDDTTKAAMAMYYPLALAAAAGLVVLVRRRVTIIPYLALFAVTTLTAAVSFGITRYRVGADVALALLAGVALDALLRRWWPLGAVDPPAGADGAGAAPGDIHLVGAPGGGAA